MNTEDKRSDSEARAKRRTPLKTYCACDRESCKGEVVEIETAYAREIFIRCDPASVCDKGSTPEQQARMFYECLPRIVSQAGAEMSNVVLERAFFRDVIADFDVFAKARQEAYLGEGVSQREMPIFSHVEQPPCVPGKAFEMQVYVVVPNSEETGSVTTIPAKGIYPRGKLVELGGYQHLYIRNVTGGGIDGDVPTEDFREQSDAMFGKMADMMRREGVLFPYVLRTWCYLDDIDRDYDEFNLSRNEFFKRENVRRLPASTGIRAGLYPQGTLCATDLYTLLNPDGTHIEVMHTPTLNEAAEYGSAFSRGMKLVLPEKTVLFISGTASVDEAGATVHVGDSRKQIERMLLNVMELLAPHGATFGDMVQVITYLKSASDLELFREISAKWGLTNMPNSIVEAGVCRPDLLCEMEAIAILPKET